MKRPSWQYSPLTVVVISLACAALFGGVLRSDWIAGRWTPSLADGEWALVSLLLTAACIVPDYRWFRRDGDAYVVELARRSGRSLYGFLGLLVFIGIRRESISRGLALAGQMG